MSPKVCIVGCGAIGSLYAAHLASVAEVYAFVRRPEQALAFEVIQSAAKDVVGLLRTVP